MRVFVITVAYCRSAQLARSLLEYQQSHLIQPFKHIVVQGHYPIDRERNNKEIELIVQSYKHAELWDPGDNIGSAQSQQWALEQLQVEDNDVFINLDPDSACRKVGWDEALVRVMKADKNCAVISLNSPMTSGFIESRNQKITEKIVDTLRVGIPDRPTPFNLSAFNCSFIKNMGGLRQIFPFWGDLEAVVYQQASAKGLYHGYLVDYMEDEQGKFFHPLSNNEWKDLHARTSGPDQFLGNYQEFLAYKYPHLLELRI